MRFASIPKAAIVTGLVGVAFAVATYSDFVDRAALSLRIPVRVLPLVYIVLFVAAYTLQRQHYEAADYEFADDTLNGYCYETASNSEFHRFAVHNRGRKPITAKVTVDHVAPLPCDLEGKMGMPLIPMGVPDDTDGTIIIPPGRTHSFNLAVFGFSTRKLLLCHAWQLRGATGELPFWGVGGEGRYEFTLTLCPLEGHSKTAQFVLSAIEIEESHRTGRIFRLARASPPSRIDRLAAWLEEPIGRRAS